MTALASGPRPKLVHLEDAIAYLVAMPKLAPLRPARLRASALDRLCAVDQADLPPQRWLECSDGERVAYRTYASEGDLQLVLVHGSACFGDTFHAMARALSQLATVHTVDLRGHGASASVPWRDPVDDLNDLIAAVRHDAPGQRIVVGGHSAGGGLVWRIARSVIGADVAGWLLLAPYLGVRAPSLRPSFGGWVSRVYRVRMALIALASLVGIHAFDHVPVVEFAPSARARDPRFATRWSFQTAAAFGPGSVRDAAPFDASHPVLVLAGTIDECFSSARYPATLQDVAPHAELRELAGLGHFDLLVDEQTVAACAVWLSALRK